MTRLLRRGLPRLLRRLGLDERRCAVCLAPFRPAPENAGGPEAALLCADCARLLRPRITGFCPKCGALFGDETAEPHLCAACLAQSAGAETPPAWERVLFYGAYAGLLRQLVLDYKFEGRLANQRLLQVLARQTIALRQHGQRGQWDLVAPVPLHTRRLRTRGFNQSLELARAAARALPCPLHPRALRRLRDTQPQFGLGRGDRISNIKNAFAADQARVRGRSVLLVDDIMTTGATVNEAARCLRRAGARRVDVLVLARAGE